ncbi:MAG: hypothetical protein GY884_18840 [Proteobacteria bacterium]|nr:hypothetical protein [Pseudomonadota bacterium]
MAAGLVAGLLMAELIARLAPASDGAELLTQFQTRLEGMYVGDSRTVFQPSPGFVGTTRSTVGEVEIRFNELGLRGPPITNGPVDTRWLVLGDSFALSLQVPEEDTFVAHLDQQLGERVAVHNGGVDGYSTWQATQRYRDLDRPLGSNAVLLVFFLGNDIYDNAWFPNFIRTWQPTSYVPADAESPATAWLLSHSELFMRWRVHAKRRELTGDPVIVKRWSQELALFTRTGGPMLSERVPSTQQALAELKRETFSRGDRLLVAVVPPAFAIDTDRAGPMLELGERDPEDADLDAPRQAVRKVLSDLAIPMCDTTEALRAAHDDGDATYLVYDGHWTPKGHEVAAQAMAACMEGAR